MTGTKPLRTETIWDMLRASAAKAGTRDAFVAADDDGVVTRLSYDELVRRATTLSEGLTGIGVARGDRVVLWMTNRMEWIVSYLALMRLGAAMVPVNTFLKPPEIAYIVAQSGARHLIMMDGFRKLDMAAMLAEICPAFARPHDAGRLFDDALPDLRTVVEFNRAGAARSRAHDWRVLAEGDAEARPLAEAMAGAVTPVDLAMVKYTSGSTGFPKGVMLEQGGIVANGRAHSRRVGITGEDTFFSMMPFFHGGGSIWGLTTMLVNASTLIFAEAFIPDLAVDLIVAERPTVMMAALAHEIVEAAERKGAVLDSLRVAHVPGESARPIMPNAGFGIQPFGLTETYGPAAANSLNDPADKRMAFSGRMLEGNSLRAVDPSTGEDVPPGGVGEAWIKGNVMRGYWNKPVETAKVFSEDGWLKSEDLIKVDEEGYITYVGRIKLMLKVGAENVSIEEVENVVVGHEEVTACCVVGVPDQRKGERVRAYVTLRSAAAVTDRDLLAWLETRLARFKMPREIVVLHEMPRLANGKLDRIAIQRTADAEGKPA
jgi:fatty-acyl-CoA synthase